MPISERDRSILEHIISYCRDIEDTVSRFGEAVISALKFTPPASRIK